MAARRAFNTFRTGVKRCLIVGSSLYVFQQVAGGFVVCYGPSMEPTIYPRDVLLTDRIGPMLGKVSKGDVVIARHPKTYDTVCKRVVGLAGESVMFKKELLEIPPDHYWLEGDNKKDSTDSRDYGPVPANLILRRCFCKIWPKVDLNFKDNVPAYCEARSRHLGDVPIPKAEPQVMDA